MSLTKKEAELLYEIRQAGGAENVEIISSDAAGTVREALGAALRKRHGLPETTVEKMNWESLAAPFVTGVEEGDEDDLTDVLAQRPEVGGTDAADIAEQNQQADDTDDEDADPIESLSAEQKADVEDKLRRAEIMADRTPEYSESLRSEAAEIVGVDDLDALDDLDLD